MGKVYYLIGLFGGVIMPLGNSSGHSVIWFHHASNNLASSASSSNTASNSGNRFRAG